MPIKFDPDIAEGANVSSKIKINTFVCICKA